MTPTPTWRDIMPAIPLARGVPVRVLSRQPEGYRDVYVPGVVMLSDIETSIRDGCHGRLLLGCESLQDYLVRVDLDDPLGYAHALRWYLQPDIGGEAPHDLLDAWIHDTIDDSHRLALARACAELRRTT